MRPGLLLLDEPFVSLDPASRRDLEAILSGLRTAGMGLVLATHDVDRAYALCDSRVVLDEGVVVDAGPWRFGAGGEDVLLAPAQAAVRGRAVAAPRPPRGRGAATARRRRRGARVSARGDAAAPDIAVRRAGAVRPAHAWSEAPK